MDLIYFNFLDGVGGLDVVESLDGASVSDGLNRNIGINDLNMIEADKKITELGLLDLALRNYEKCHFDKGYEVSILSAEPEMLMLVFTLLHMDDRNIACDAMLLCDDMPVGEFIRFFGLEVYGDLERFNLERVWSDLYMTGRARLEFDARPPFSVWYSEDSKLQTLEDLREFCRVIGR